MYSPSRSAVMCHPSFKLVVICSDTTFRAVIQNTKKHLLFPHKGAVIRLVLQVGITVCSSMFCTALRMNVKTLSDRCKTTQLQLILVDRTATSDCSLIFTHHCIPFVIFIHTYSLACRHTPGPVLPNDFYSVAQYNHVAR